MTVNPVTVTPEDSVAHISVKSLTKRSFHHLPVVGEGRSLVGIISKEDFHKVYYELCQNTTGKTWTEKEYTRLTAKDIMTQYPMSLDPEDSIGLAADVFLANKFHSLPVIDDGQLMGIVTTHDLLAYSFCSVLEPSNAEELEE